MRVTYELMACADCLMYVANGDEPDDRDIGKAIERHLGDPSGHLCCGDSEKDDEFSWAQCECCGSNLGGSRHHLVMLGEEKSSDTEVRGVR